MTTTKRASAHAPRKPTTKTKPAPQPAPPKRSHHKKPAPTKLVAAPMPAPKPTAPVVAVVGVGTPQAQVVTAPQSPGEVAAAVAARIGFDPDDANIIGPGLRERAAACRAVGEPLTASPGFHLVVQKGVLDQEADPPAAPPPKAEPTLSAQLKAAKPAASGEHRWVKTNLVTISKGGKTYDTARCSVCGATAKRYGLGAHTLDAGMPARCPVLKTKPAPQSKSTATPAPQANGATRPAPPTPASWGKSGSQAEAYKRLLMTTDLDEAGIHKAVEKELGKGKAGPLSYVAWYRSRLRRDGFTPTGGADRG